MKKKFTLIGSMDEPLYNQWFKDAFDALSKVYTEEEANIITEWFKNIKGASELELVGADKVNAHSTMIGDDIESVWLFSVYASMMSRMWIYAPYILREHYKREQA